MYCQIIFLAKKKKTISKCRLLKFLTSMLSVYKSLLWLKKLLRPFRLVKVDKQQFLGSTIRASFRFTFWYYTGDIHSLTKPGLSEFICRRGCRLATIWNSGWELCCWHFQDGITFSVSLRFPVLSSFAPSVFDKMPFCITNPAGTWRLYNVVSTSMQRHDVASTLGLRCIDVVCLLGRCIDTFSSWNNTVRFLNLLLKKVHSVKKEFDPRWSKLFPYRKESFSEGILRTLKQAWSHKNVLPCQ